MKQKYSHLRQAEEKSETHYLKSKIWWYVFEFLATCCIFLVYGSDRIFLINYLWQGKCMMYFIYTLVVSVEFNQPHDFEYCKLLNQIFTSCNKNNTCSDL